MLIFLVFHPVAEMISFIAALQDAVVESSSGLTSSLEVK